jgi:hypothetical protein
MSGRTKEALPAVTAVVDQAIDQGDDAGGVWKDLAPFCEGRLVVTIVLLCS